MKLRGNEAKESQATAAAANRFTPTANRALVPPFEDQRPSTVTQMRLGEMANTRPAGHLAIVQRQPIVLQAKWTDQYGVEHDDDPPPGWLKANNNVIGEHYYDPGGEEEVEEDPVPSEEEKDGVGEYDSEEEGFGDSEESSEEPENSDESSFEPDSDDGRIPAEERYYGKRGEYRSGRRFYKDRQRDTRKTLVKRQSSPSGRLYSRHDQSGPVIPLDKEGREIRKHKKSKKDKQPDIDHRLDWIAIDQAVEEYSDTELSEAEKETFKDHLYNVEDNLEILAHEDHKSKKRTTRDALDEPLKKKAKLFVKAQREVYSSDLYAQRKRNQKRERLKKLAERKKKKDK
ncbi:hypothetical protein QWY85_04950 [Neolewinella lacunae]|uniref:Uncharacterized protein n=1 Tax=Neolewinella lacunae TaxID=1517758 RepID=A0A923TA28_9BACT|nr:hypothetical protein [Neolewinella lacunae]MBC6996144.1 hypothetical protein [Neolewinella lacunae]MDN3633996.1 hypothetical protein [Neolewinella lacunae]